MNKEEAVKILNQCICNLDDLCDCVFKEGNCIGCREKAIEIVLQELDKYKNIVEVQY